MGIADIIMGARHFNPFDAYNQARQSAQQSKLADIAIQNKLLQQEQQKQTLGRQQAFRQDVQDMGYTPGMSDPREIQDLYAEHFPMEYAQKIMSRDPLSQQRLELEKQRLEQGQQRIGQGVERLGLKKERGEKLDTYRAQQQQLAKERQERAKIESNRDYDLSRERLSTRMSELEETRGKKVFNQANKLSESHYKKSKEFIKQRDAYDRIEASATDPSAAGDLALIFNYMKVLDPGSTVREGEFANAESAGAVDDKTRNWYNKVITGQRLSTKQRKDFVDRSKKLFDRALTNQDKLDSQVKNKAKLFKIDPNLVMYDYKSGTGLRPKIDSQSDTLTSEEEGWIK
jgi:hypothetical protein